MAVCGAVFIFSTGAALREMLEYRAIDKLYEESAAEYTRVITQDSPPEEKEEEEEEKEKGVPITVDFEALRKINEDVVGWIYCEGTRINYPVLQGENNEYYLNHNYRMSEDRAGSIFVEMKNTRDFADANTIIHGHHMKNGAMFATLSDWADQAYYEEHPIMWLLTPEQNYRVDLFAGYLTPATSDTYLIFKDPGKYFDVYLSQVVAVSDIQSDVELPGDGHYVILSTCEYDYQDARYVLYGLLTPADGAG